MHSFKLKNRRKRWWRCLGAVRSVISSRGKQVQAWKKVPEGPWTLRRAETQEAQQRDAFPVSPGLRARNRPCVRQRCTAAAPGDEWVPTLSLLPRHAPLSPCKRVCGSVMSFPSHCARPPPRQSRLIPLTRNTHRTHPLLTVPPLLDRRPSQHPAVKCPPPLDAAHRPSFPLRRARSLLLRLIIQSQPFSTIFILFWSIILKLIRVCAIFNYFKLIGSSSNWTGRSPRSGPCFELSGVCRAELTDTLKGQSWHCTGFPGWQPSKTWKSTQEAEERSSHVVLSSPGCTSGEIRVFTNRDTNE